MKMKSLVKAISVVLSFAIFLTVLPLGTFAVGTAETPPESVITITDNNRVRADERDNLNVIVVDNGDGTNTMTIYDHPVKFVNENGVIEDISFELESDDNGAYNTKKNNIKTSFPKKARDGINLKHKDLDIKLTPKFTKQLATFILPKDNDKKVRKATVEPIASEVNVIKLDSEAVSYYYDSSTRLEYSLTYTGFKEDIVVSEYTGQTEYVFTLETNGLTLECNNGLYYLTDNKGNIKANLGQIVITTADGNNDTMGYMTHKEIQKDQVYELTIHVDGEWLADENTKYPIRIDPTVEIRQGEDEVEDITINSNAVAEAGSQSLYVGYREGYGVSRVLMKFPGLVLADVLTSKNIRSAEVCMYDTRQNNASMKVIAYLFTGNEWVESTASWSNVNAESYTHFLSQDTVSYGRGNAYNPEHWYKFNIIDYIKLCMNEPEHIDKGIMFKAADSVEDAGVNNYKSFGSFDGTELQRPHITVTYDNENNTNTKPFGWFDSVTDSYASGWAWCVDAPNEAVMVNIKLTNNTTGQVFTKICAANIYRADVKNAGYGTGYYGFKCPLDWSQYTPGQYTVRAIAVCPGGSISNADDCYELKEPKSYVNDGVLIRNTELSVDVDDEVTPSVAAFLNGTATNAVTWTVENSEIVEYNATTGKYRAESPGITTMTATIPNTDYSATCEVWVRGKTPVFLIHGRTSNSFTAWGAGNRIFANPLDPEECNNNHFDSSLNALSTGSTRYLYTNISAQEIFGYNSGLTITVDGVEISDYEVPAIFNGKFEDGEYVPEHPEGGNLAHYLKQQNYEENINLFVFNYPNQDAVKHSALKFEAYINNLIDYVRSSGSEKMKACFYRSRADYEAENHKINLVGHSMGGLVSRYYIENLSHDTNVDKLITICTPHWGSDLANTSCIVGDYADGLHVLCDHDLRTDSAMYGGDFGVDLDCLASLGLAECYAADYTLTDELQYNRSRLTSYYAIAGISYYSSGISDNDLDFELEFPQSYTDYAQLSSFVHEKTNNSLYTIDTSSFMMNHIPMSIFKVDDNVVSFLSQIGWTDDDTDSPSKKIEFEKIYVCIDTDGGNSLTDHFHGKMPHREDVVNKVLEYLME